MDDLDRLRATIQRLYPGTELTRLSEEQLAELRREYPGIPEHYLAYLHQVGYGDVALMFYAGPVSPEEIFGSEDAASLEGILFIADDFAGWSLGLDSRNGWRLVGVDSAGPQPMPEEAQTLAEFVGQWITADERA